MPANGNPVLQTFRPVQKNMRSLAPYVAFAMVAGFALAAPGPAAHLVKPKLDNLYMMPIASTDNDPETEK